MSDAKTPGQTAEDYDRAAEIMRLRDRPAYAEEFARGYGPASGARRDALTAMQRERDDARTLAREILREVELGTLGQHTPQATARTLARTAAWRQRAGLED